ncbi:MAG: glycoside hydrolase family 25 protein [Saprospiraceae bacterium]|nr:glycoside hydrolase family 25 protein [Saprospiraceae bacterium]
MRFRHTVIFVFIVLFGFGIAYRSEIKYYLEIFISRIENHNNNRIVSFSEKSKINSILENNKDKAFGIDISQYQGIINWQQVDSIDDKVSISFVIIRATIGSKKRDKYLTYNWRESLNKGFIHGVYHYYRPDENSIKQAENFIKNVKLKKGDLPPILDIESLSSIQSTEKLKLGIKRWLDKVEKHYNVKPIIYTGDSFYESYLNNEEFNKYTFWIANYNNIKQPEKNNWKIWQFSEKGKIAGISEFVDLNVVNGDLNKLKELLIK